MISVKHFIEAIQRAVSDAADVLADKNQALLEQYFNHQKDENGKDTLVARMVTMGVPETDDEGNIITRNVEVPLISLMPLNATRIEKATLSVDLRMSVNNGELTIHFPGDGLFTPKSSHGHLDIVLSPDTQPEGLQQVVDYYTDVLKRQL
jgi:hypothetical protein